MHSRYSHKTPEIKNSCKTAHSCSTPSQYDREEKGRGRRRPGEKAGGQYDREELLWRCLLLSDGQRPRQCCWSNDEHHGSANWDIICKNHKFTSPSIVYSCILYPCICWTQSELKIKGMIAMLVITNWVNLRHCCQEFCLLCASHNIALGEGAK